MLELVISPEAEEDLTGIWVYIAQDQIINADRFLEKLELRMVKLCQFPSLGRDRPELGTELKSFSADRYTFYYIVAKNSLIIIRVLRDSLDIQKVF